MMLGIFNVLIGFLYIFGETSIQIFSSFFNMVICLFIILNCKNSLLILDISFLLDVWIEICSSNLWLVFQFLWWYLLKCQSFKLWWQPVSSMFSFIALLLVFYVRNLCLTKVMKIYSSFSLKNCIGLALWSILSFCLFMFCLLTFWNMSLSANSVKVLGLFPLVHFFFSLWVILSWFFACLAVFRCQILCILPCCMLDIFIFLQIFISFILTIKS